MVTAMSPAASWATTLGLIALVAIPITLAWWLERRSHRQRRADDAFARRHRVFQDGYRGRAE